MATGGKVTPPIMVVLWPRVCVATGGVYVLEPHMMGITELVVVSLAPRMDVVPLEILFDWEHDSAMTSRTDAADLYLRCYCDGKRRRLDGTGQNDWFFGRAASNGDTPDWNSRGRD